MLQRILSWLGFGGTRASTVSMAAAQKKALWTLVNWDEYVENLTVFMTANGTSEDAVAAAQHDYFSIVGVPVDRWTYSAEKPAVEPKGFRWFKLEGGFELRLRL